MNVVKDLQSLIQLMHSRDEVIIFPVGAEGQTALDFFRYTNLLHRVCCIATPAVAGGVAQTFIHEVPVIPFENLVHFRETALIITITPEQFQAHLDSELTRLGFKTVVFVNSETHAQIKSELQKLYSTGQILMWYMQHFDEAFQELKSRVNEVNEITDLNRKTFDEYQNLFSGRDVVIVGSGPTLAYYKPIPNAIHIGLNYAWRNKGIEFDYLFTTDNGVISTGDFEDALKSVRFQMFVGRFSVEYKGGKFIEISEEVSKLDRRIRRYYLHDVFGKFQTIYQDIRFHTLMHFGTVAFDALHFSFFTHPRRIYLVGCDTSPTGHFYNESKADLEKQSKYFQTALIKTGYARARMFAKQYYPDTEIISINPVGLRGLFKDVYTEEYKASLAENSSMTPNNSTGGRVWNKS